ncbi:MAG: hypothetical protein JXR83_13315 [Deltaproteobacteria bacterium]|nr:hypothetical protein [Deltaproteobacteria bacterium]
MERAPMSRGAVKLGALLLAAGCGGEPAALEVGPIVDLEQAEQRVCASGSTLDGTDVSHHEGLIDWDQVKAAGIQFAIVRVGDGTQYDDYEFGHNWSEAYRVGIIRGAYQYFRPSQDPIAQADIMIEHLTATSHVDHHPSPPYDTPFDTTHALEPFGPGDLAPTIDVETLEGLEPSAVVQRMHQWIDRVEAFTGRDTIIYTGLSIWRDQIRCNDFADHPLWIALYTADTCPTLPPPWDDTNPWTFWQTGDHGTIPGINAGADLDLFNGDIAALTALAAGTIECGDGHCNGTETHLTCPEDCPCEEVPAAGRIVDESEVCFTRGGNAAYWYAVTGAGHGDTLLWTHATDSSRVDNFGVWHLEFAQGGRYRVEAWMTSPYNGSQQARYLTRHAGAEGEARVDQSAATGWALVGDYDFAAGVDQWVRLDDNTGEPYADRVQLVFDAIRLTPLGPAADAGTAVDAGIAVDAAIAPDAASADRQPPDGNLRDAGCDDASPADAGGTDAARADSAREPDALAADVAPADTAASTADAGSTHSETAAGCSCATTRGAGGAAPALFSALCWIAWRRRGR